MGCGAEVARGTGVLRRPRQAAFIGVRGVAIVVPCVYFVFNARHYVYLCGMACTKDVHGIS